MLSNDEMEQVLESLMEELSDRAGTGGKSEDDKPLEGDYGGADK